MFPYISYDHELLLVVSGFDYVNNGYSSYITSAIPLVLVCVSRGAVETT